MPRCYCHTRGGPEEADDFEGLELDGEAEVYAEALRGARSLIAGAVLDGRLSLVERIEVEDESGKSVLTLPFADAVKGPG